MKPLLSIKIFVLALTAGFYSCTTSQYAHRGGDDMYHSGGNEVLASSQPGTTVVYRESNSEIDDSGAGVGYNSKTVNPDYGLPQDADIAGNYQDDQYYVEDVDREYIKDAVDDYLRSSAYTVRRPDRISYYRDFDDIYWSDPFFYQGTIFDPLYRSYYGVYSPFAYRGYRAFRPYSRFYRPWGRYSGFSMSFNFGFGYGPYGRYYYDPFFRGFNDPFYNRFYDPFYDPFFYGGFARSYYGFNSFWCPPSYYGRYNNVVIVNNIESATNSGNVRYARRAPRGSNYIINNDGIRQRSTTTAPSSTERIRVRDRSSVDRSSTTERTRSTTGTLDRTRTTDGIRSRDSQIIERRGNYNSNRPSSTESRDRIDRTRSNDNIRRGTINRDNYREPTRTRSRTQSTRPSRNYQASPSRSSGSRVGGTRSSSPPSRMRSTTPSRSSSPSRMRSSSPSRNYSPSRSTAPSRSTPSRSTTRTRSRN